MDEDKTIKVGYLVRFDFSENEVAYGTVNTVDSSTASVKFKNPITREKEDITKLLIDLTLIGRTEPNT